jgi:hypothetical protein
MSSQKHNKLSWAWGHAFWDADSLNDWEISEDYFKREMNTDV